MDGKHSETPKLIKGNMQDMASLASGLSLDDIKSTELKGEATVEIGQTWKASVKTEDKKPIDPASFKMGGSVGGSFHGRFGGFAEPHPEGVAPSWSHYQEDSGTKPAAAPAEKISSKATSSKKEAAVKKAKPVGEAKKKKLTKAEKEIEARTHSDSMLGPVIPGTEADTRTDEEKLQGDAWEKAVGGVPEPEKNKEKQLSDEDLDGMMVDAFKKGADSSVEDLGYGPDMFDKDGKLKIKDERRVESGEDKKPGKPERPKTPEEVEYDRVWAEWKRSRDYFNGELTNSTGELKDRKFVGGIEHQFQEKYDEFLRNQGAWKFINAPRRFFGMRPLLPDGLKKLEAASSVAREQYFESAKRLKELKEKLPKGIQSEERTNFKDKQGRTPFERYQAMLARKLVIGVGRERLAIQQKVAMESEANSVFKKFKPTLEAMQKHRYKLLALRVLGYGAIGAGVAATGGGGLLVAGMAGGLMSARVLTGAGAGLAVGTGLHLLGRRKLNQLHSELENTQVDVQQNLFNKGFASSEAEVESLTRQIRETQASTKIASVGGAAIAGLVAGNLAGNIADSLAPFPHSSTDGSHPKWEGSTTNTPNYVYGQSVGEGGMVSGPPPELGSISLIDVPDPKLQGVPADLQTASIPPHPHAPAGTNPPPWEGSTTNTPKYVYGQSVGEGGMVSGPPPAEAGSIHLTDVPDPKLQGVPSDLRGVELPNETPIPEPRPEVIDAKLHTVVKGENAWNIMEGRGPDSAPVGGESDFLKKMDLPMGERQELLDQAVKQLEQNPELAKEIGAVKSEGNIHKIYPGEQINITKFDELLRQIYDSNHPSLPETAPVPESAPEVSMSNAEIADGTPLEEVEPHEPIETDVPGPDEFPEHGPVSVQGKDGVYVVEGRTADVNQLTLRDASNLMKGVVVDDPNALSLLEEMNTDKDSFMDVVGTIVDRAGRDGTMDMGSTISEWMKNSVPLAKDGPVTPSMPANNDNVPEVTPYGFDQPIPNPDTVVREAGVSGTEAVTGQSLESYVRSVEQPKNGIFDTLFGLGKPNVAGSFDQLQNLTIGEIKDMVANDNLPKGVSETGFDVWAKEVANAAANDNDKTLAEYVSGLANSRVA